MTLYESLKLTHVLCVVVSGLLFVYRYTLLRRIPRGLLSMPLRVLPHINDTILLAAAIAMLVLIGLNPFQASWLIAKMIALFGYVIFGAISLRADPGSRRQTTTFVVALTLFAYIVLVAMFKQAVPV